MALPAHALRKIANERSCPAAQVPVWEQRITAMLDCSSTTLMSLYHFYPRDVCQLGTGGVLLRSPVSARTPEVHDRPTRLLPKSPSNSPGPVALITAPGPWRAVVTPAEATSLASARRRPRPTPFWQAEKPQDFTGSRATRLHQIIADQSSLRHRSDHTVLKRGRPAINCPSQHLSSSKPRRGLCLLLYIYDDHPATRSTDLVGGMFRSRWRRTSVSATNDAKI